MAPDHVPGMVADTGPELVSPSRRRNGVWLSGDLVPSRVIHSDRLLRRLRGFGPRHRYLIATPVRPSPGVLWGDFGTLTGSPLSTGPVAIERDR